MRRAGESRNTAEQSKHLPAFVLLLAVVFFAPWPLGSNRQWAWAILELGAYGLLAYLCIGQLLRPRPLPTPLRDALPGLALLGVWLFLQLLQCMPLPASIVSWALPDVARLGLPGGDREGYATLSLAPGDSFTELLKNGAYCALLISTLWLTASRARSQMLMYGLLVGGGLNAIFGVVDLYLPGRLLPWLYGQFELPWVVGSYANRNHFAALMAMCVPVGLGLAYWNFSVFRYAAGHSSRPVRALDFATGPGGGVLFLVVLCVSAILLSGSRGGVIAVCTGCGLAGLLFLGRLGAGRQARPLVWLMLLVVALSLVWTGTGVVGERVGELGLSSNRVALNRAVLPMVGVSPLIGFGGGTFETVFPSFKTSEFGLSNFGVVYTHAHNDFLEAFVEYGLVGCVFLGGGLGLLLCKGIAALRKRRDPLARSVAFGCVGATTALLVQGLVDFNFHIPATAAIWFVVLGAGCLCATLPRAGRGSRDEESGRREKQGRR